MFIAKDVLGVNNKMANTLAHFQCYRFRALEPGAALHQMSVVAKWLHLED